MSIKNLITGKYRRISLTTPYYYLLVISLFILGTVQSQDNPGASKPMIPILKGVVKNAAGEGLDGATVSVRGINNFTITKKDGNFELKNVPQGATLRISFVGYVTQETKVKKDVTLLVIKLNSANGILNEVVINTGLYKRPVGNFTGAAKTYSGDELRAINPVSVFQALSTLEPGMRIAENNVLGSDPNQLPIIQLRGQNNLPVVTQGNNNATATPVSNGDIMSSYLLNPNQPLIILDGFQAALQTIVDMDINRIARITVLKDAAATVAYGSKAANGVIVIETKQPTAGRIQVTYSVTTSLQVPDLTSYHLLDGAGLLEAQRIAGVYNDPNNHFNDVSLKQWYDQRLYQVQSGVNTDWLTRPVQTGFGLNHSLSISGGARAIRFSLSLNYNNTEGVIKESSHNTFGISNTLSYSIKNFHFSNSTSVNYAHSNNSPWGSFGSYAQQFPFFKPTDSSGNVVKIFEPSPASLGIANPAPGGVFTNAAYNSTIPVKDYSYYLTFTNNTSIDWSILNSLHLRAGISVSSASPGVEQFYPADHTIFTITSPNLFTDLGSYTQTRGTNNIADGNLAIDFNKKIGRHTFMTTAGVSAQQTNSTGTTIKVTGIPNDYLAQLGLGNGYGANSKPSTSNNYTRSLSRFASVSYNYDDRYTVEFTDNSSGSSQFGSNNRLAPFYAGGLSWNVSKEKFFVRNPVIQQLTIKVSTGITGNQNFSSYLSQPIFQYGLLNNYRLQLGATLQGYANPDLKWQRTVKNNLGINMGLFNGRLNISADGYIETTNNLILPLEVTPSTGFVNYSDNLGATKNQGYEFTITAPLIRNRRKDLFWSVSVNAGHYTNVITQLSPAIDALNKSTDNGTQTSPLPRFKVGQSMSQIWAVRSLGIDPATGQEIFLKLDGTQTFTWDANDKVPCGDATSKLKGNFGSSFSYKGFSLSINMGFEYGGQMYNQTLVDAVEDVNLKTTNADERVLTLRWQKPGDIASFKALQSFGQVTNATSRFVQDNNYLQASSMSVGYTFPSNLKWVKALKLATPRIAITQNNVFRIATIKTERGTGYPFARSFSFGLSSTF